MFRFLPSAHLLLLSGLRCHISHQAPPWTQPFWMMLKAFRKVRSNSSTRVLLSAAHTTTIGQGSQMPGEPSAWAWPGVGRLRLPAPVPGRMGLRGAHRKQWRSFAVPSVTLYFLSLTFKMVYGWFLSVRYPPPWELFRGTVLIEACSPRLSPWPRLRRTRGGGCHRAWHPGQLLCDSLPRRAAVFTWGHRAIVVDGDLRCESG